MTIRAPAVIKRKRQDSPLYISCTFDWGSVNIFYISMTTKPFTRDIRYILSSTAWHCIFVIVLYCIESYFEFFHAPHTEVSIIKIGQFLKRHQCNWVFPSVHLYSSNFSSPIINSVGEMGLCHGKITFVWTLPEGSNEVQNKKKKTIVPKNDFHHFCNGK